jgi:hypothetical protein
VAEEPAHVPDCQSDRAGKTRLDEHGRGFPDQKRLREENGRSKKRSRSPGDSVSKSGDGGDSEDRQEQGCKSTLY